MGELISGEKPIYTYGLSWFERVLAQLAVQLPAYLFLLWMAFIAYLLIRNFITGAVDWKVAVVIVLLLGVGCLIARLGLMDLPKPFEAYDREGVLYIKRGKEQFRVIGIQEEYSVQMKTKFNRASILRLTCHCLKLARTSFQRNAGLFAIARDGCLSGLQRVS